MTDRRRGEHSLPALLPALFAGEILLVRVENGLPAKSAVSARPQGLLSGSFNPLHQGHVALRAAAADHLAVDVIYELPVANADKPPLGMQAVLERVQQFGSHPVVLTRAATFVEKAELFPGAVFIVGWDTALRILDCRFYGGDRHELVRSLGRIRDAGCRFLVAGRMWQDEFRVCRSLDLPSGFADLFEELPPEKFRLDISSTEIRNRRAGGADRP